MSARRALEPAARARTRLIVRGLRPRHFLPVPALLGAVLLVSSVLLRVPGLDIGWWTAIGGSGNPVFGMTEATAGSPFEILIPLVFMAILIPALPLLAAREEEIFRLGAENWSTPKRVWRGVLFGLVHAVIGIPVAVALALSVGGWWFTYRYLAGWRQTGERREALLESTRAHLAYNATIVGLLFLTFLALALLCGTGAVDC